MANIYYFLLKMYMLLKIDFAIDINIIFLKASDIMKSRTDIIFE